MSPNFNLERESSWDYVVGIDEAGCGPWAGPVTVSAVVFHRKDWETVEKEFKLNDSKKLTAAKRDLLFDQITESALTYGIASATSKEIDDLNIVRAVALATERALLKIECPIHGLLIDGIRDPKLPHPTHMVIRGDGISCSIAAASILAKVTRDRMMAKLAQKYPFYGWETNAGYGTKIHQEGIARYGITEHHRRSYAPIRKILDGCEA